MESPQLPAVPEPHVERARVGELFRGVRRWVARRARAGFATGLPSASPAEEQVGFWIGTSAVLWMLAVALWQINAPFGDGHFASTAAIGVAGDNMWRHGITYPVLHYSDSKLDSSASYMHHPLGVFWIGALFVKVLGTHNWVLRLPAVLYSTLSTLLVHRIGRAFWGPLEGALAAVAFAALPITLGFANFHALEGPVILGLLAATWGYARFTQTWRFRYAVASIFGFSWAVNHDFIAYVWGALFLSWVFARGFLLPPRAFGYVEARPFGRYWGLMVAAALSGLVLFVALLFETNKLAELLRMYAARSSGNQLPLSAVLRSRHIWIGYMFPGLSIALGVLAVPIVVARFVVRRIDLELIAFFFLAAATFQYVHFKQGADYHIFWSQYFAPYFALAVGALVATVAALFSFLARRVRGRAAQVLGPHGRWLAAGIVALPVALVFRDGASMIRLSQESGGRFNSTQTKSDIDRVEAMRWWIRGLKPPERIAFHPGIAPIHWSLKWELRPHHLVPGQGLGTKGTLPRAYALDTRYATTPELRQAVTAFHVQAVGPFWFIDRTRGPTPLAGYVFDEREPGPLEWYLARGTEPVRTVRPDPWATWEWRSLFGQPAPAPEGTPGTLDQLRIAHNVAVSSGDQGTAKRLRDELARRLDIPAGVELDDGTTVLGARHHQGAQRTMTILFLAGDKPRGRSKFAVYAKVEKRSLLSTLPLDPQVMEVAEPPAIPTDLWRAGHIYPVTFSYRKRPGRERFFGAFVSLDGRPAPAPTNKLRAVDLLTVR